MNKYYETRYTFNTGRSKVWKAIAEYLQKYINPKKSLVVDLGAGYCDFINNIKALEKFAVDTNPASKKYCNKNVKFINEPINHLKSFRKSSVDTLFASNLLEHLDDKELNQLLKESRRILKKGAIFIALQPNFKYAYKEYFDDYTHKKIFTHISLKDYFESNGFEAIKIIPRFLPFSLKSRLPKSYILTKIYIASFYKPMAKQMLLIFRKK